MNSEFAETATDIGRRYRLASQLYLERFGNEALLLVVGRDRLLTIDGAAADLFSGVFQAFGDASFTIDEGRVWLGGYFELTAHDCCTKVRGLLAFALRHGLVQRVVAER